MGENPSNQETNGVVNGTVKDIAGMFKGISDDSTDIFGSTLGQEGAKSDLGIGAEGTGYESGATFKMSTNLPEKTGVWTKIKNVLLCEIKVELTPYQQKIEDEINEFLHQEVTWQSFKNFLFSEVPVTYKGKRIF